MEYIINLPEQFVQVVMAALADGPHRIVDPVIRAISIQIQQQQNVAAIDKGEVK